MASPKKTKAVIRTRRAILEALKTGGATAAQTLADQQGISAMAIRQHLYQLNTEKLVIYTEESQARGRPIKMWHLTAAADQYFPDAHAELTGGLIAAMRAAFGEEGLDRIVKERTSTQIKTYRGLMSACRTLPARIKKLAKIRTAEGYMAEAVRQSEGSYHLIENHCPICTAARACQGLCASELTLFQAVLGDAVKVERADHIIKGDRRCVYIVQPVRSVQVYSAKP